MHTQGPVVCAGLQLCVAKEIHLIKCPIYILHNLKELDTDER